MGCTRLGEVRYVQRILCNFNVEQRAAKNSEMKDGVPGNA